MFDYPDLAIPYEYLNFSEVKSLNLSITESILIMIVFLLLIYFYYLRLKKQSKKIEVLSNANYQKIHQDQLKKEGCYNKDGTLNEEKYYKFMQKEYGLQWDAKTKEWKYQKQ